MDRLLEEKPVQVSTCGVVLQEVLQGCGSEADLKYARLRLWKVPYLEAHRSSYLLAVHAWRRLRARGVSLPPVDALIASVAMEHGARLWTLDRDFHRAARFLPLRLYETKG